MKNLQVNLFFLLSIVFVAFLFDGVIGHSYITSPTSRGNQKQSLTGCRGPSCLGPCEKSASSKRAPITVQRGQTVNIQWPRNNHAGGFIRIAWAPTSQSDSHAAFDGNVQEFACHERGGCKPDNANDKNGGDSAPADGSFQPCQLSVVVPSHLTDGEWTLQWAWFGGAFALGDYYSCVDYKISGGASGSKAAPFFVGGDFTYPNQQKCKYFNTDQLHRCVNEPCSNAVYPSGERSGPPAGVSSSSPSPSPTPNPPSPTPAPTPTPTPNPPSPTPSPTPTPNPTPSPTPTPSPNNGRNCAGVSVASRSTATMVSVDTWGNTIRAVIELRVQEATLSNWYVQIIWPSNAVSTRIQSVFNAGSLQCEATSPNRHAIIRPSANWAKNLKSGTVMNIEIMATNSNMNRQFIQSNTQLRVFTS